jgi:hypothetical protein
MNDQLDCKKYLKTVWIGWLFWKKRYYQGSALNVNNLNISYFNIEADWFDTLTPGQQQTIYEWEYKAAYKRAFPLFYR